MRSKLLQNNSFALVVVLLAFLVSASAALGQTTSFTYQGRLTDGGLAANGNYDLQFALFDSLSGGTQIGSTQTLSTVAVTGGVFTVSLDFGANSFTGANRLLEIRARLSGTTGFIILDPRQAITSTPYAVRSASAANSDTATNATQLGGIAANQYVQTNDSRLSDPRPPTPGSSNYIQNSTNAQANTNFNISGNGTVSGNLSAGGSVGLNTSTFLRPPSLQFGTDINAAFTISPSDTTPNAGYIRFGDKTGWKLYFGRSRESSGGALNTGTKGVLMTIQDNGNIGIGITSPQGSLDVAGDLHIENGTLVAQNMPAVAQGQSGLEPACIFNDSTLIRCPTSSSLRYKRNVTTFHGGLEIVNRLQPISFTWKGDGTKDIGFGAEDVEKVAPIFTFKNEKGEIEGVRYDRLGVLFVNAFKEQQAQIEQQQEQLTRAQALATRQQQQILRQREQIKRAQAVAERQQQQLDSLQKLVCRSHRRSPVCR
jgi:hypothetical protein